MNVEHINRVVRHGDLLRNPSIPLVFYVGDGYVRISETGEVSTPNQADVYLSGSYILG